MTFGEQLVARFWERMPASNRRRLGFAHGAAGIAFAALTCGKPANTDGMVAELRRQTVMLKKGVHWPVRIDGNFFMPGWCNGVAGHLLLWTKLWQRSAHSEDREMLERVAWGLWESRTNLGNICCGGSGQAIALACFATATGDENWRNRAIEFLEKLRPRWPKDDHPQSLFRGELGLHLAEIECRSGAAVQFPVWGQGLTATAA